MDLATFSTRVRTRPSGLAARATGALVAVLIATDTGALVHVLVQADHSHRSAAIVPVASTPNPPSTDAAALWAARELSHGAKVIADPTVAAALAERGFTHAVTPAAVARAATFDYTISTTALRATAASNSAVKYALAASVPIAVFGTSAQQVVVRQVSTMPADELATRRAADLRTRRAGERELLTNPAVRTGADVRAALQAGRLDLRAATVISLMANTSHVEILRVNVDAPERSAGLPARSVDVRTDADAAVEAMLSNLPPTYKPTSDTQLPSGARRLIWPIDPVPPLGLN